jgi:hypothetical protein
MTYLQRSLNFSISFSNFTFVCDIEKHVKHLIIYLRQKNRAQFDVGYKNKKEKSTTSFALEQINERKKGTLFL